MDRPAGHSSAEGSDEFESLLSGSASLPPPDDGGPRPRYRELAAAWSAALLGTPPERRLVHAGGRGHEFDCCGKRPEISLRCPDSAACADAHDIVEWTRHKWEIAYAEEEVHSAAIELPQIPVGERAEIDGRTLVCYSPRRDGREGIANSVKSAKVGVGFHYMQYEPPRKLRPPPCRPCCWVASVISLAILITTMWPGFRMESRRLLCLHGDRGEKLDYLSWSPWKPEPPALDMKAWTDSCKRLPDAPSVSRWEGQNLCWAWMKQIGCYDTGWGTVSWREGQRLTARKHHAPFPNDVSMEPVRNQELCEGTAYGAAADADAAPSDAAAARAWLGENVAVYVVHLPRDAGRMENMSARLGQLGVHRWQVVEGVDLTRPDSYTSAVAHGWIPEGFNLSLARANARSPFNNMGEIWGTMGCAAAHFKAMQSALTSFVTAPPWVSAKPLALVLEDDVRLADGFPARLRRLLEDEAPCDWSAISLKTKCPYGECISPHLTRVQPDGNEPAERCRHGVNYGFYAMLYRLDDLADLRDRLARVVWDADRPHCLDIDVALASISDEVAYYAVPGWQTPGFLTEGSFGSSRVDFNAAKVPSTTTTTTATATITSVTTTRTAAATTTTSTRAAAAATTTATPRTAPTTATKARAGTASTTAAEHRTAPTTATKARAGTASTTAAEHRTAATIATAAATAHSTASIASTATANTNHSHDDSHKRDHHEGHNYHHHHQNQDNQSLNHHN